MTQLNTREGGVAALQRARKASLDKQVRVAAPSDDAYSNLLAEGTQYCSNEDWDKAAKSYREAIALRPDLLEAYFNLGNVLSRSGHLVEAAQRYLESMERTPVGSERWARATAAAFDLLRLEECGDVIRPTWWDDEVLKELSASVMHAAPNDVRAHSMRAVVLSGLSYGVWDVKPRTAAELNEAADLFDRAAALSNAAARREFNSAADQCLSRAEADQGAGCKWCTLLKRGKPLSPTKSLSPTMQAIAMPGAMPGATLGVVVGRY